MDAIPEIIIKRRLEKFDKHAILITEELDDQAHRRWPTDSNPIRQPLMFFCDPTDRSLQLEKFFKHISKDKENRKIGDLMTDCNSVEIWEKMFEAPITITGSTGAITCVRKSELFGEKEDPDRFIHHREPPGPPRTLYLSELVD